MGDSEHWIRDLLVLWSQIDYVDASSADPAARALATEPSALDRLLLGAHALALGNRTDVRQQLESLDSLAAAGPQYLATGDPVDARAVAEALRAVASERDGNRSDAIRRLEAALPGIPGECPGEGCPVHGVLRFQLGRWLLDEGQPARAEPYFASLTRRRSYGFLPVSLYLGKAYEALGNLDDARREYEMFAQDWQDCDPELRPLLDDAKQSLARMKEVRKL
jgi:tetratricopeptide (TPR) repeat protein